MNDYREVRFTVSPCTEDATDLLAQLLADIGYESFLPDNQGMTAYVRDDDFDAQKLADTISAFPIDCKIDVDKAEVIEGRDWNAEWEKHYFKPIVVDHTCVVHSSFHHDIPSAPVDIVIDPKMAFGTGHHATTFLIINEILKLLPKGQTVIDMGTGTGILAILCSKLGAEAITAIEIDQFAFENTQENVKLNGCQNIRLIHGDATALEGLQPVDLFIANINRNVITADLPQYVKALKPGGRMLLSGFYVADIPTVLDVATPLGMALVQYQEQDNWCVLTLEKN